MQSPAFKSYLNKQDVPDTKLKYYPYYAEDFYKKVEEKDVIKKQFPEGFNLLFAGNIGDAQSFDTIIDAVEKIKKENVNVVVLGEGRDKKRV